MTSTYHDRERRLGSGTRFAVLMTGILSGIALLMALPATGLAAEVNFGAKLNTPGLKAVKKGRPCKWDPTSPCTRLPLFYANPSHVGVVPYAPHAGVIKKIKLIARKKGSMRIQIGEASEQGQPTGEVTTNGPKIKFKGTGEIERFKVHIPVSNFDYVGFKAKRGKTLSCKQPGLESTYQFDPPLVPGAGFQVSSWQEECTPLIQARLRY